jgi:hypothetical protein
VAAIVALAAAVLSFVLIRSRDFVGPDDQSAQDQAERPNDVRVATADGRA